MTLTERVRNSIPPQPSLRKVSLRIKLVASVLVLVFAALTAISAASTYALHNYLLDRLDTSLSIYAVTIAKARVGSKIPVPNDYYVSSSSVDGVRSESPIVGDLNLDPDDTPPLVKGFNNVNALLGEPYTVRSPSGDVTWRVVLVVDEWGQVIQVGEKLSVIGLAVNQMVWVDLLVGVGVLIALASIGAAIVRQSLVPLLQIERTAAAIGAGDLTQRVPDPEAHDGEPQTELGRLAKALNAMLAQIEAAFSARAQSEAAARAAEAVAVEAADQAQASEARAVQSEGKMRQFVADASHELRTPLTTIRGFAELYRQGAVTDPDDVAKLVRRIEDEAARMGLLVEDLLLLARLDRERPLTLAPVELPVLALDAVQAAEASAPERTIELHVEDSPERLVAYGDDARLRQVIGNLMTNALVHTPPDAKVTLSLRAGAGDEAVVEVSDTGPGLSEQQTAHVFERFYRADEARTRRTGQTATGTGLGLAIVAAIVRAHDGRVEVLSEPGRGATFRVTLPTVLREVPADDDSPSSDH
ncbi:HAMP domain-containing histidine kinase [Actinoplanes sp. LDG1-06]|uniref:histidine kinase n=1 Tax=Paractinoplanes ovalisporus TaxID=2810368 RepID=A0ABS2APK7_9ACTN|nr:HAMP domain-containing sensor histidine kinase [Actinoplanes ovalisporus]MBM2621171.1 HAMP domain-containing histidine kinase [Actinoplanes ovalisporus]